MFHWTASRFVTAREIDVDRPQDVFVKPAPPRVSPRRAEHARMLEHAATRRRRAASGEERDYWRACAPAAVDRAARLRCEPGFAHLP